jgi:hypothetical protein
MYIGFKDNQKTDLKKRGKGTTYQNNTWPDFTKCPNTIYNIQNSIVK